jgi:dsRNA-specific ribonuclease
MEKLKSSEAGEYWRAIDAPKVLSDVMKSILGAVLVDAGLDLTPVEAIFNKWFLGIYENHIAPETIVFHPVTELASKTRKFGCKKFTIRYNKENITLKRPRHIYLFELET